MIPLSTLQDKYIGWRKLTEQKKPSGAYSSAPTKGDQNKYTALANKNVQRTARVRSLAML